jgi:hypothetical protein
MGLNLRCQNLPWVGLVLRPRPTLRIERESMFGIVLLSVPYRGTGLSGLVPLPVPGADGTSYISPER